MFSCCSYKHKCWDEYLIKLIINRVIVKRIMFRISSSTVESRVGKRNYLLQDRVLCFAGVYPPLSSFSDRRPTLLASFSSSVAWSKRCSSLHSIKPTRELTLLIYTVE